MWEVLVINFCKILKANWKSISIVIAILGFISFLITVKDLQDENVIKSEAVSKWYQQLPEDHWIKEKENDLFGTYDIMDIYQVCIGTSKTSLQLSNVAMQQEDSYMIQFLGKTMEHHDEKNKEKYNLRYNNTGKKVRTIKIKVGESTDVSFYYDDIELLLDYSEEEYNNEIQVEFKIGVPNLANKIVYSYVDDTSIAQIYDGKITGIRKGKATLHLFCNGYHFKHNIQVKNNQD